MTTPAAGSKSAVRSATVMAGRCGVGNPAGISPINGIGAFGATRAPTNKNANTATASASVGRCVRSSAPRNAPTCATSDSPSTGTPVTFVSWLTIMKTATPARYPMSTGWTAGLKEPEPGQPAEQTQSAHDEGECGGQRRISGRVTRGQRRHDQGGHQRGGGFRAHRQLPGRADHGINQQRSHDRPQPGDRRQPGDLRIRHDLRDEIRGHGYPASTSPRS